LASILLLYIWKFLQKEKEVNARLSRGAKMRICEKNIEGFAKYTAAAACLNELRMEVKKIVKELTIGINGIGKKSHFLKWDFFPIESIPGYIYSIMIV
jgi:hypothetical protein